MNRINFNKLYYFYVVAKEGSVKSASKKLHLTQPTISAQIKQLEEELGFDVFIRKHRKLELNRNGRFVLKRAEKLFNLADELVGSLPLRGKAERTKIRIGAIQSLSNSFIYDFSLRLWSDESIMISISQGSISDLIKKMDKNELDLILSDGPYSKSKKYKSISLGTDKIVAVGAKKNNVKNKKFPEFLSELPYLAFSNQGRLQEDVDYFFKRENIQPDKIGEVDDVTLMRIITENSDCFSVLPYRAVKESIANQSLKVLGEIKEVHSGLWALIPSLAENRVLIRKLIKDYFMRKK
tara:strand:- start:699 stop:1583 length:885 start_codon:yes stop_codon:yes gene_type:complete